MSLKIKGKCVCCEQVFNELEADNELSIIKFGKEEGGLICYDCESDDFREAPANVVLYKDNKKLLSMIVAYYNFRITDNEADLIADASDSWDLSGDYSKEIELLESYAKSVDWKSSSAWRGHYEGNIDNEMIRVIDSWFGMGGHNINGDLEAIRLNLEDRKVYPDFLMLMCFLRTSNVCSTGVEVYIKKKDEKEYRRWLEVANEQEGI